MNLGQVSVIIRSHQISRLPLLDEALFSLSTQTYPHLQIIIVTQDTSSETLHKITQKIKQHPFSNPEIHRVISFSPSGTQGPNSQDGRAQALNLGLEAAQGEYIAFLDDDDIAYPQCYEVLIHRIQKSGLPVAVGGCRAAFQRTQGLPEKDPPYFTHKRPYLQSPKNQWDLFVENFIPIHSFLIRRTQIDPKLLNFTPGMKCFEDYEVLLKLASNYLFDWGALYQPLVEYRIRDDGSNTIPTDEKNIQLQMEWNQAKMTIQQLKNELKVQIPAHELQAILQERDQLKKERGYLTFRIAAWVVRVTDAVPQFKSLVVRGFPWLGRKLWSLKRKIARLVRYND